MSPLDLIAKRRHAEVHTREELIYLAQGAAQETIPDYQLAAWLMAAVLNPLTPAETAYLTLAMADSGARIDLTGLPKPWVDKHSTGGVGDKTTLVLLPMLAACGLTVVKMSGRGLGITGGTVDKLSAVPGFRLNLTPEEMKTQAAEIGLALTGQSPDLAPADKALYVLRDATGTVDSIPLIVSSILSKKIAGGAETVVLDVKWGSGAFMKTREEAERLRLALEEVGRYAGLSVRAELSDMDQPLGRMVGNALEVREALEVLGGRTEGRFPALCIHLAGLTLHASGSVATLGEGEALARASLQNGSAREKARAWFEAQGADPELVDHPDRLEQAPVRQTWRWAGPTATVRRLDAGLVGQAGVDLGGGRRQKEDTIDVRVGIELFVEVGSVLEPGDPVLTVHAKSEEAAQGALAALEPALEW